PGGDGDGAATRPAAGPSDNGGGERGDRGASMTNPAPSAPVDTAPEAVEEAPEAPSIAGDTRSQSVVTDDRERGERGRHAAPDPGWSNPS
ncbi:MAG: hypothetical protein WA931_06580, partial [Rhodococcus sp. (in: high G+C Gram-positive bacteria)]